MICYNKSIIASKIYHNKEIDIEIRYLGTAATEGCPALFCKCNFCESLRRSNQNEWFRTRSQVLVNHDLLVDFPPDTYLHFLRDVSLDLSASFRTVCHCICR